MGYHLYFTKLKREHLPPCGEEFVGGKVWQHWCIQDENFERCEAEEIYEKKNIYLVRDMFSKAFKTIGVDWSESTIEVSKNMLQATDVELVAMSEKIAEAIARGEIYDVDPSDCRFLDADDLKELQDFRPTLLEMLRTFNFEDNALVVNWA
jgi:hypothetical protein